MSDKKKARGLLSPQVKADIESIYGKGSADFKVEVDRSLAFREKPLGGLVRPEFPNKVFVAETPDFEEHPRLRDIVIAHEAGHLQDRNQLHLNVDKRGRIAAEEVLGPKNQSARNLETLKRNPEAQDRVYDAVIKEAQEKARDATGPLSVLKKGMQYLIGSGRYEDETLSDFLVRRTGKPLTPGRGPGG